MAFAILWYARSKLGSKVGSFGCNFKVQIVVDSDVIKPCKKITGSVIIETQRPIKHQGILIQFEGACTLKYPTKSEGYTTNQHGREVILEGAGWKSAEAYFRSPIQHILKSKSESAHVINPGSVTYPFELDIPENPHLPAPFRNELGCLVYRLVVYMAEPIRLQIHVEIGQRIVKFNGHYNLFNDEAAMTPVSVEKSLKTSVFARKKLLDLLLLVEKSGFLPGEIVTFSLSFKNLQCLPLQISVQLMQHLKYNATNRRESIKRKVAILAKLERMYTNHMPECTWMDSLRIPEDQVPSFTCHYMYNVAYCIQFKVKVLAEMKDFGSYVLKGEAPLYIGTTRSTVEHLRIVANSDVPREVTRRSSANSIGSSFSIATTTSTLPPAYSQLSSRIPSWETLPPSYDELELDDPDEISFDGLTLASATQFDTGSPNEKSNT
ncbi:pH-response regulator protein palF/RIM8 [Orchesella cincta]|uniref:pH-response regulator protein palF/RIM8 n=1 Tax=Orchesella cincta TaxID=48709 RepID=A0A1D2NI91_ORCCI|nr:pH-response regulator protein palF/RIM8 [Orchesella cincta]